VADFESKLQRLSRRGTPVGAEEMIERIEAELAGDPLVVVTKQREGILMTNTDQPVSTKGPGPGRGLGWALVTFVAILTVGGLYFAFSGDANEVVDQVTVPTPTTAPETVPTPTTVPEAAGSPIDISTWTAYESDRYGFTIGHPSDWTVDPADHDWTLAGDADDFLSTGHEAFRPPDGHVRVSAWLVPLDPGTTMQTTADVEAWVEQFCPQTDQPSCTGMHDRAIPLCKEGRDCHPGLLVPFAADVQAFFFDADLDGMVVVAVWVPESAETVAPYGGAQALLKAFLATMEVCPVRDRIGGLCPEGRWEPSG
jgi:hypothetical protein